MLELWSLRMRREQCAPTIINTIFSASNIDEEIIKVSDSIFIEGYLIASPEGKESFQKAIELAELHAKVLVSLSDSFIVNSFKNDLKELLSIKCDLIFCNEAEAENFLRELMKMKSLIISKVILLIFLLQKGLKAVSDTIRTH